MVLPLLLGTVGLRGSGGLLSKRACLQAIALGVDVVVINIGFLSLPGFRRLPLLCLHAMLQSVLHSLGKEIRRCRVGWGSLASKSSLYCMGGGETQEVHTCSELFL
jgi:hypothetical protein